MDDCFIFAVLFWVAKQAYRLCFTRLKGWLLYVYIFLGLLTLHQNTIVWVLRLTGIQRFSENIFPDKQHSLIFLSSLYMLVLGVIIMLVYFSNIRWHWKIALMVFLYIGHWLGLHFDLIIYKEGWFLISTTISIGAMYLFTYILDKLYESRGVAGNGA